MPVATALDLQPVVDVVSRLRSLLQRGREVKPDNAIEPYLPLQNLLDDINSLHNSLSENHDQIYRANVAEAAARQVFYSLLNTTSIDDPGFVDVWNLLDILLYCGDNGICATELVCHLAEELLDSQTTTACRTVFNWLESRRDRLAQKDFHKKNLVFLRSCNELLRRLSRAEDASFCGRVFFFLFQTFPLGDKSSVNLRGEFHTENTTTFDEPDKTDDGMDVETGATSTPILATPDTGTPQPPTKPSGRRGGRAQAAKVEEKVLSSTELYPIFWRLQKDFSEPARLLVPENLQTFKQGLSVTLTKFKKTPTVVQTTAVQRGIKRKVDGDTVMALDTSSSTPTHLEDTYSPKYLTSRDLFDLELSDQAFQRHILVQSLILIDFLLSLTQRSKTRLAAALTTPNKSLLYPFILSDEDAKWASTTRLAITSYMQQTNEGKLFARMVETVLARDKNWIRWKLQSCPSIVHGPTPTDTILEARANAVAQVKPRRVPSSRPMGALDLSFLDNHVGGLEALRGAGRTEPKGVEELLREMQGDELDLEMAGDEEERSALETRIASKKWRLLRLVRANDFGKLDKISPAKGLEEVLREQSEDEDENEKEDAENRDKTDAGDGEKEEPEKETTEAKVEDAKAGSEDAMVANDISTTQLDEQEDQRAQTAEANDKADLEGTEGEERRPAATVDAAAPHQAGETAHASSSSRKEGAQESAVSDAEPSGSETVAEMQEVGR